MDIYFAGSIRAGREDVDLYLGIIKHLQNYGHVLTEHVADKSISIMGEDGISDAQIHDRDMDWLTKSRVIVAEVTRASLGVGYEIGRIVERNSRVPGFDRKHILCLYRPQADRRLSAMISGSEGVINYEYTNLPEALEKIDKFFTLLKIN